MKRICSCGCSPQLVWALTLLVLAGGAGCSDGGDGYGEHEYPPDAAPSELTLQILHASDMEAGSEAVAYAPRFSAILDSLRDEYPAQTVVVSSGDNYLPGPFFSAGETASEALTSALGVPAPGRADIMLLNAMGFQAATFGNHEFDFGPATVASLIQSETVTGPDGVARAYPGASFPWNDFVVRVATTSACEGGS